MTQSVLPPTADTELPAAAAISSDTNAAPTAPAVYGFAMLWDGTNWIRVRGDATNGLDVDVTRLPALAAGTNNIGDVDVLTLPALPAGTNNIGDVDVLTLPGVVGTVAHDAANSGAPVLIGAQAETAAPAAVADNDRAQSVSDRYGRALTTPIDPGWQVWKQVEYTAAQTGTAIWTPAAGKRVAIEHLTITTGGTTAGVVTIWAGATADTTFSQGTDQVFFRGEFAPSATARPGAILNPMPPLYMQTTDHVVRITTSAGITVYVTVYGWEFTP